MENLGKTIGNNLTYLRKKAGLTQMEFGEKFNYSDKTVSRWEQGDVIPAVDILKQIVDFYGVSMDYMLSEHSTDKDFFSIVKKVPNVKRKIATVAMIIVLLFAIAITVHVAFITDLGTADLTINKWWNIYLWMLPVSFLILAVFSLRYMRSRKLAFAFASCFVWTILVAAYVTFLYKGNYWFLFFIGIPVQIALIISYRIGR